MAGKIPMGKKELLRGKLMAMVEERQMALKESGGRLGISYRQVKRIKAANKKNGDAGLVHGNSGKESNRKISVETRKLVIGVYQERYSDFGTNFAAEKNLVRMEYSGKEAGILYLMVDGSMVNTPVKDEEGSTWRENKPGIVFNSNDVRKRKVKTERDKAVAS
jgi:hypothetical protein